MKETIVKIPAVALRGMTVLPGMIVHFDISREKSIKAIEAAMVGEQEIFLITQLDIKTENPTSSDLYEIGIVAEIKQVIKLQKGIIRVLAEGKYRAKQMAFTDTTEYLEAEVICLEDEAEEFSEEVKLAMLNSICENFVRYAKINGKIPPDII